MKNTFIIFIISILSSTAFAVVAKTPALLRQKDKFSDVKMFEAKSIYADRASNIALLKEYQSNPNAFKPNELFPIAICYLTVRDFERARTVLEIMAKDSPKLIQVWRTLGSANFLVGDLQKSVDSYKKAFELGDEFSAIYCCSALALARKSSEIKPFLPNLQKFAKINLEALNVLLTYSIEFPSPEIDKILADVFTNIDARKVILSSNPESLRLVLRVYMAKPSVWTTNSLVIPARAAALFQNWNVALDSYKKVLEQDPNNSLALRGMGLVQYRLGDVSAAANAIKKAYDVGDKDAAIDGIELFLLSKYRFIWDMFKNEIDISKLSLDIRAGLVQYASTQNDCAEMFYNAIKDSSTDVIFKDKKVRALVQLCLDKYGSDPRSRDVATRLFKASGR